MERLLLVALGGAAGSVARYMTGVAALRFIGPRAPWASTFIVNVAGGCLMGLLIGYLAHRGGAGQDRARLFLAVGVLGGFTTFSTFGWGTDLLIGSGQSLAALIYLAASVAGGVLAVALGMMTAREAVGLLERGALAVLQRLNARGHRRFGDVRVDMASIEAENRKA
jgi:fluoride exporter